MCTWEDKLDVEAAIYDCPELQRSGFYIFGSLCLQRALVEEFYSQISLVLCEEMLRCLFDITIEEDNQARILDAQNLVVPELSKCTYLRYQFLVDHAQKEKFRLNDIPTDSMVSHTLLKNLK